MKNDKRPSNQNLKYVSLVVLLAQNVSLVLCIRYSRTFASPTADGRDYLSSTAVVICEVLKLVLCLAMQIYLHSGNLVECGKDLNNQVVLNWQETLKLLVPAGLYTIQNNLLYVAIGNLPAAVYQVVYNLKILTTAIFSVFMLKRHLVRQQWISLIVLVAGVSLIQPTKAGHSENAEGQNALLGMVAVLSACCLSGFAGVYFEKILKGSSTSLWIRNIQMAAWSILLGLAACLKDADAIKEYGFFQGYSSLTALIIFLQAAGGLIVAIVVKYSDNIIKGFATSSGIIVSSIMSSMFMKFNISLQFILGSTLVVSAVFMYSLISKSSKSKSSKSKDPAPTPDPQSSPLSSPVADGSTKV